MNVYAVMAGVVTVLQCEVNAESMLSESVLLLPQGLRPDESLDMDLALPLFQPHPAPEPQHLKNPGGGLPGRLGAVADILPVPRFNAPALLPGQSLHPAVLWALSYPYIPRPPPPAPCGPQQTLFLRCSLQYDPAPPY